MDECAVVAAGIEIQQYTILRGGEEVELWSLRKWVRGRIRNWRFDGAGQSLGDETGQPRAKAAMV